VSTPSRLNRPPVGRFTREDFERAWQGDPPSSYRATQGTAIVVRRSSHGDSANAPLTVLIDDERIGEIEYGQVLTRSVEPGRHLVSVFGGWSAQTIAIDAGSDERVRLQCGRGSVGPRWLSRVLPLFASMRVWLTRE
jgi:hypothetical protein